ncbi:MAG: CoA-binding protein [Alphaproteobacteria bacterium HGW-Alphaproteobacteria-8]|nr:MAG: CoA-binding protein [Alphaproteobacteria bacterium HGW-Alphaproteobacteria-8]
MKLPHYSQQHLRAILKATRRIAAVGVSVNPIRPSSYVARYLTTKGFEVIPVNPAYLGQSLFGRPFVGALTDIPAEIGAIDMVEIFRRSEQAGAVVDEALETLLPRGLKTIWMQIGVIDWAAAARAEARGVTVIMNHCPKIEYQRLFNELRIGGFNTGIISSKLR